MTTEERIAFCNQLSDSLGRVASELEHASKELAFLRDVLRAEAGLPPVKVDWPAEAQAELPNPSPQPPLQPTVEQIRDYWWRRLNANSGDQSHG